MSEIAFVKFINTFGQQTIIDAGSIMISSMTFLLIFFTLMLILILTINRKKFGKIILALPIALILHFLISELLLKHTFDFIFRTRPYLVDTSIITLGLKLTDSSFPSSHVASVTAVLFVMVYYYRKTLWAAMVFILLLAFSRIHNGMHYPTDILAGLLLGLIYGVAAIYLSKLIIRKIPWFKNKTTAKK